MQALIHLNREEEAWKEAEIKIALAPPGDLRIRGAVALYQER